MQEHYKILSIIFEIVKTEAAPHTYLCTPREIILKYPNDWTLIQSHLASLVVEKLIIMRQLDKIVISITEEGIAKAKSLKNNFINNNYTFPSEEQTTHFSATKP